MGLQIPNLQQIWDALSAVAGNIGSFVENVRNVFNFITDLPRAIWNGLVAFGSMIWDAIRWVADRFHDAWVTLSNAFSWIGNKLREFGNWIYNGIVWLGKQVWQLIVNAINWIAERLADFCNWVRTSFETMIQGINQWWCNILISFRQKMKAIIATDLTLHFAWKSAEKIPQVERFRDIFKPLVGIGISPIIGVIVAEIFDAMVPQPKCENVSIMPVPQLPEVVVRPLIPTAVPEPSAPEVQPLPTLPGVFPGIVRITVTEHAIVYPIVMTKRVAEYEATEEAEITLFGGVPSAPIATETVEVSYTITAPGTVEYPIQTTEATEVYMAKSGVAALLTVEATELVYVITTPTTTELIVTTEEAVPVYAIRSATKELITSETAEVTYASASEVQGLALYNDWTGAPAEVQGLMLYNDWVATSEELTAEEVAEVSYSVGGEATYAVDVTEQSGNDLTDYPVRIDLDPSWDGWDLNPSKDSIYFTDEEGNPLYYWIEKFDTENKVATIWVKVPSISANGTVRVYMHVSPSNPYLTYRDPAQVFDFFDDFDTFDTAVWTEPGVSDYGGYTVENSNLVLYIGTRNKLKPSVDVNSTFTQSTYSLNNRAIRFKMKAMKVDEGDEHAWFNNGAGFSNTQNQAQGSQRVWGRNDQRAHAVTDASGLVYGEGSWNGSLTDYEVREVRLTGSQIKYVHNDVVKYTESAVAQADMYLYILIGCGDGYGNDAYAELYIDFILIRKYVDPEPTVSLTKV
ncbi:DUF2341 domain-containing protein [bacterium]|nr:DUF2341 domain-containing protein [bacterium]